VLAFHPFPDDDDRFPEEAGGFFDFNDDWLMQAVIAVGIVQA